ncbi:hypothetical protein V8C35DRAFT_277048 [Trichoderma chlorosporum]
MEILFPYSSNTIIIVVVVVIIIIIVVVIIIIIVVVIIIIIVVVIMARSKAQIVSCLEEGHRDFPRQPFVAAATAAAAAATANAGVGVSSVPVAPRHIAPTPLVGSALSAAAANAAFNAWLANPLGHAPPPAPMGALVVVLAAKPQATRAPSPHPPQPQLALECRRALRLQIKLLDAKDPVYKEEWQEASEMTEAEFRLQAMKAWRKVGDFILRGFC